MLKDTRQLSPCGADSAHAVPLSHEAYLQACQARTSQTGCSGLPRVQVQKRFNGRPETLCARVLQIKAGESDWFQVDTSIGSMWAESRNVRLCSGDGRCACDSAEQERGAQC